MHTMDNHTIQSHLLVFCLWEAKKKNNERLYPANELELELPCFALKIWETLSLPKNIWEKRITKIHEGNMSKFKNCLKTYLSVFCGRALLFNARYFVPSSSQYTIKPIAFLFERKTIICII